MKILQNRNVILFMGCMVIFFPGAFLFGFPGLMPTLWQQQFAATKSEIGQIMFFILMGTGFSMYIAGKLQEKIAFHYLIFTGSLVCSLAMFYAARAQSINDIYIWGFVSGFFCGFIYVPILTIFQIIFPGKSGLVTGIINLTFGGAAAVFSPFFSSVLVAEGHRFATDISGAIALIFGTSVALLVRIPKPSGPSSESGHNVTQKDRKNSLSFVQTLKLKSFWMLWLVWAMAGASGISLIVLSSSLGVHLGYDITGYVYILVGFNIMNGVGRLVCGRLSDSFPRQKILAVCFTISAGAYFMFPFFNHLAVITVLSALVGLSFGSLFTVSAPLVSACFGLDNFGRVFGMVFTAYGFVAGMLGPWLSGVILDRTGGNFNLVFVYFAVMYLVAAMLILKVVPVHPPYDAP